MKTILSRKSLNELREYFVSTNLRIIDDEFQAAGMTPDLSYDPPVSGMRRTLVEQYFTPLDLAAWEDVRKLLDVFEVVLQELGNLRKSNSGYQQDWVENTFDSLVSWLKRDGFVYENGRLNSEGPAGQIKQAQKVAAALNVPEVSRQVERILSSVDTDPSLAIGTAKELLETTCKTILEERAVPYQDNDDVPKLVKETRRALKLLPHDMPENAKGADSITRILSSLGNIGQGIAELRNLYGTGHGKGKGKGSSGLSPRHVRLAVGAATTLAMFFVETHQSRKPSDQP